MNRRTFAKSGALWLATAGSASKLLGQSQGVGPGTIRKRRIRSDSGGFTTGASVNGFFNGFTVPAGEIWQISGVVESDANIIVEGTLKMRAGSTLRFVNVNESAYVGDGMNALQTDIGLWVLGDGDLDIEGTARAGWNDTGWDSSWQAGDELVVAPTDPGDFSTFAPFPLGGSPPTVDGRWNAEVLNLTRDVVIEGTPGGRAHIIIISAKPQTVKHCIIRHMGPRQDDGSGATEGVIGRYGLHFHHCNDGSRGSLVEGVVVRDTGFHSFVPHVSNGITFRDCIAYDVFDDAFWWDLGDRTDDTLYDHCIAAQVRSDPEYRGFTLAGFTLGLGTGNSVRNCVATGIQGNVDASGFHWSSKANAGPNTWEFIDNLAHNNVVNGIFVWQNTSTNHVITGFAAYRCGQFGIEHGAYRTPSYHYKGFNLFENSSGGLAIHSVHGVWDPLRADGYGLSFEHGRIVGGETGIVHGKHSLTTDYPTLIKNIEFIGQSGPKITIDEVQTGGTIPGEYDYVNCDLDESSDVYIKTVVAGCKLRIQNTENDAWEIGSAGAATPIAPFYVGECGAGRGDCQK